jgi:hypothetical protein
MFDAASLSDGFVPAPNVPKLIHTLYEVTTNKAQLSRVKQSGLLRFRIDS